MMTTEIINGANIFGCMKIVANCFGWGWRAGGKLVWPRTGGGWHICNGSRQLLSGKLGQKWRSDAQFRENRVDWFGNWRTQFEWKRAWYFRLRIREDLSTIGTVEKGPGRMDGVKGDIQYLNAAAWKLETIFASN